MMTALMYKKPENHIQFLEDCLDKAKQDPKVRWHSFIEPLPPIPKASDKIQSESSTPRQELSSNDSETTDGKQTESVVTEKKDEASASTLAEQVFKKHMDEINSLDDKNDDDDEVERPWYADYTEKNIDTSAIQGKPIVFVLGRYSNKKIINFFFNIFSRYGTVSENTKHKKEKICVKVDFLLSL